MGYWLTFIGAALVALGLSLIAADIRELMSWSRKKLFVHTIPKLPENLRKRFAEEWQADIDEFPGEILKFLRVIGFYVSTSELKEIFQSRARVVFSNGLFRELLERAFSVCIAALMLVAMTPLFLCVFWLSWWSGLGGMRRYQVVGKGGRMFGYFYFPTGKVVPADLRSHVGHRVYIAGFDNEYQQVDYPVGIWLSRVGLGTLPAIFNVLLGDMNIIGPSPRQVYMMECMRDDHCQIYLKTKPGLISPDILVKDAGWTQQQHFVFEYLLNRSFWTDIRVLFAAAVQFIRS